MSIMNSHLILVPFLAVSAACYGAVIQVVASCSGGRVVQSGNSCSVTTSDRFGDYTSTATASLSSSDNAISVFASTNGTRFLHSVSARASFRETYSLTFYGGTGLGAFLPNLEAAGYANASFSVLGGDSIGVSGLSSPGSTSGLALSPDRFRFTFGEALQVEVLILGYAPDLRTGGLATFRNQFRVAELLLSDSGPAILSPLADATWDLEPVPEPSTVWLAALGLLLLPAITSRRASGGAATRR